MKAKKCGRCGNLGKIKVWTHLYPEPEKFEWKQCPRCLGKSVYMKVIPPAFDAVESEKP